MEIDLSKNTTICGLLVPDDLARLKAHPGPWVWYDILCHKWFTTDRPMFNANTVYRTVTPAPVPDRIDWTQIDDRFICMARDKWAMTYVYVSPDPILGDGKWFAKNGAAWRIDNLLTSYKRGTVDWRDSLVFRPGYEGAGE